MKNYNMIWHLIRFLLGIVFISATYIVPLAQNITETVRGTVIDNITKDPLIGANIILLNSDPLVGSSTELDGSFRLENVPVGLISLKISFIGYHDIIMDDLQLTSGKELVLNIPMEEMVYSGGEVVIVAKTDKSKPLNRMTSVSARSFTVDETRRYAGSRNDVARMASNYAGVQGVDDARNDIIIRGNSPTGLLWRLEGVDIPNPNHFGAMGTTGGPVSILNNNVLTNSDFMTGAFPAEYGNAVAGIFDLRMRTGNNQKHEFLGQIGFNGFEFGAEGPMSKKKSSSYLVNARYSTLEVFKMLGVNFGTGTAVPEYQDITFKLNIPSTKAGNFSIFALGGISYIQFLDSEKDPDEIDFYAGEGFDLTNGSDMAAIGLTHTYELSKTAYVKTILAYTYHRFHTVVDSISPDDLSKVPWFRNDNRVNKLFGSFQFNKKVNTRNNFKTGIVVNRPKADLIDSIYNSDFNGFEILLDYSGVSWLLQPYLEWQFRVRENVTINTGLHYQYFTLNNTDSWEPRVGINWQFTKRHALSLGYGRHTQLLPLSVYYRTVRLPDGTYIEPNRDLNMIHSHHYVMGYDFFISENMHFKSEIYWQDINKAAIDGHNKNSYSIVNFGADFYIPTPDTMVSEGTGTNYGLEITFEQFLNRGLYFLFTTSLYESKYKGSDGEERNTAFNGNYILNGLVGKEWNLSKKPGKTYKHQNFIFFDIKAVWAGGRRYTPIDVEESLKQGEAVYDTENAYGEQYKDYFRTDLKIGFRQNSKRSSMEWLIDFQNIFNTQNIYNQKYNTQTGEVSYTYQMGILVIPQWRIMF